MTQQLSHAIRSLPSPGVGYLGATAAAQLVRSLGVRACLEGIARRIEEDFRRWPEFQKTARIASHCPDGVIELMPVCDSRSWSFKYVNGHPRNFRFGRPTVMAFGALARVDSGEPEFISELTLTTALRTAAMSALAARCLARTSSRTMALIGNGSQAEFQALAFHFLLGIRTLRLFDTDARAMRKLADNLRSFDLEMIACRSPLEACSGADIITTATADWRHSAVVTADMVEPGMHINAVGGDSPGKTELAPEVLRGASVFVEFEPQTRLEGEIQQMAADYPVTELWQALRGDLPARRNAAEVTIFDSVGFALEDFSALHFMREQATRLGLLVPLDLIPVLRDPKNLYALVGDDGRERTPGAPTGAWPAAAGSIRPAAAGPRQAVAAGHAVAPG